MTAADDVRPTGSLLRAGHEVRKRLADVIASDDDLSRGPVSCGRWAGQPWKTQTPTRTPNSTVGPTSPTGSAMRCRTARTRARSTAMPPPFPFGLVHGTQV